ncbi:MAG TPA: four helix bundle protein [Acidimicrobiia bacterium]|nr:four helix bundle protein [Acidimicrobiia bacterium]
MHDFRDLNVWHKARSLAVAVYGLTASYPTTERFGLVSQTRRAAVSVTANIAEGCGRRGSRELARFVDISLGSIFELESHLILAGDLHFLGSEELGETMSAISELKRMLVGLAKSLARQD